jgi:hypothetical protein
MFCAGKRAAHSEIHQALKAYHFKISRHIQRFILK